MVFPVNLQNLKKTVDERQVLLTQAKVQYKTALKNLEKISDEIHQRRRSSVFGPRGCGVGSEDEGAQGAELQHNSSNKLEEEEEEDAISSKTTPPLSPLSPDSPPSPLPPLQLYFLLLLDLLLNLLIPLHILHLLCLMISSLSSLLTSFISFTFTSSLMSFSFLLSFITHTHRENQASVRLMVHSSAVV